jgi:hypothetical protein
MVTRFTAGATVLRGRCLPYGDGITFWPLRVMLSAADIRDDDKPEEAQAKLMAYIGDQGVVDRVAAATGLNTTTYPLHEIYWAARKLLEIVAARGPVVALVQCATLFCTYPAVAASAALARVTLARMSDARAVQMNDLGSML